MRKNLASGSMRALEAGSQQASCGSKAGALRNPTTMAWSGPVSIMSKSPNRRVASLGRFWLPRASVGLSTGLATPSRHCQSEEHDAEHAETRSRRDSVLQR